MTCPFSFISIDLSVNIFFWEDKGTLGQKQDRFVELSIPRQTGNATSETEENIPPFMPKEPDIFNPKTLNK